MQRVPQHQAKPEGQLEILRESPRLLGRGDRDSLEELKLSVSEVRTLRLQLPCWPQLTREASTFPAFVWLCRDFWMIHEASDSSQVLRKRNKGFYFPSFFWPQARAVACRLDLCPRS